MKVAINDDFGGFGLSDEAFEMLLERKCIEFEKIVGDTSMWNDSSYYEKGHLNESEYYISKYDFYEDRSDSDLIFVIEKLGKKSAGCCASLKIVEIPDDVEWEISEYDGNEHIAEVHRTWY